MSGRCRTAACIGDAWLELGASALLLLALGVLFVATPAVLGVSYSGAEEEVAAAVGLYVGCRAVMSVAGATVFLLREAMVDDLVAVAAAFGIGYAYWVHGPGTKWLTVPVSAALGKTPAVLLARFMRGSEAEAAAVTSALAWACAAWLLWRLMDVGFQASQGKASLLSALPGFRLVSWLRSEGERGSDGAE